MVDIKLLSDVASKGLQHIPETYIRHDLDGLQISDVNPDGTIPIIDLKSLSTADSSSTIKQIGEACSDAGFFQVTNHGVPEETINSMLKIAREFFHLPEEERIKFYSDDPLKTARLSTSFNQKTEKFGSWRDYLRLHCYPLEDYINEWPTNPPSFREVVAEYSASVRGLVLRLLEAMSKSLGLQGDAICKRLGKHQQHMAINYYPPCPQPELTYGLPGHTDPNAITVLLQDHVPGLQVFKSGRWVAVNPTRHSLVVNVGDQIQVLSNDRFKSALHRAVVNRKEERVSIPTFYCPCFDAAIGPIKELIDAGEQCAYKNFTYLDYYKKFWDEGLHKESCLDLFNASIV